MRNTTEKIKFSNNAEFLAETKYGSQLRMIMKTKDLEATNISHIIKNPEPFLGNKRIPNSVQEHKLMAEIGYIPLLGTVRIDEEILDKTMYMTFYDLLNAVIVQTSKTVTDIVEDLKRGNVKLANSVYSILRGERPTYYSFNCLMAYFGKKLIVKLIPADEETFNQYRDAVIHIARTSEVYDKSLDVLLEAKTGSFYYFEADEEERQVKPKKQLTTEDLVEQFKNVSFVSAKKSKDVQSVLDSYTMNVKNQIPKLSITALEAVVKMSGRRLRIDVEFDERYVTAATSRAKNDAIRRRCYSLEEALRFVGTVTYGAEYINSLPLNVQKVINKERQLTIAGLNQLGRWFSVSFKIYM